MPRKWNVGAAAVWGLVLGGLFGLMNGVLGDPGQTGNSALTSPVGGAIAGALWFAVIAAARNFFVVGRSR